MKKQNWISLVLIVLCIAAFVGYRAMDRLSADTKAPEITMDGQMLELSAHEPRAALLQGVSARDQVDGDVSGSLVVESVRLLRSDGTAAVTYAACDSSGNVTKATREIRYNDYRSPLFSLDLPLLFSQNSYYDVLSIVHAEDILDGDISHRIRATVLDEVTEGYVGTHNIQVRVTNSLGDMVELVLPVETYTPGLFEGSMTLTDYLVYIRQGDSFNPNTYLDSFTLGREETSLRGTLPEDTKLLISGKVDTGVPGVYTVDYKVTKAQGEQLYSAYSRLIVVVEG